MNALALWFSTPLSTKSSIKLWVALAALVFVFWMAIPIMLGGFTELQYLAITLSFQNLMIGMSIAFGEETVFRVLPIVITLHLFPDKIILALMVGMVTALPFALWHDRIYTVSICLGLGSVILVAACLKFGAAAKRPFGALIACGSIHTICNFIGAIVANICTS